VLRSLPFSLDWGDSVYAKLSATNLYGDSEVSLEGNGAVITTTPFVPINLAEDTSKRTKSILGITWDSPVFTGGDVIIDYRISIAVQGGSFSELADGIATTSYDAINLDFGTTYEFKVEARNSYSYSAYSSAIPLLCAYIPEPPLTITTLNVNELVTV
jgi:hypothetical protein